MGAKQSHPLSYAPDVDNQSFLPFSGLLYLPLIGLECHKTAFRASFSYSLVNTPLASTLLIIPFHRDISSTKTNLELFESYGEPWYNNRYVCDVDGSFAQIHHQHFTPKHLPLSVHSSTIDVNHYLSHNLMSDVEILEIDGIERKKKKGKKVDVVEDQKNDTKDKKDKNIHNNKNDQKKVPIPSLPPRCDQLTLLNIHFVTYEADKTHLSDEVPEDLLPIYNLHSTKHNMNQNKTTNKTNHSPCATTPPTPSLSPAPSFHTVTSPNLQIVESLSQYKSSIQQHEQHHLPSPCLFSLQLPDYSLEEISTRSIIEGQCVPYHAATIVLIDSSNEESVGEFYRFIYKTSCYLTKGCPVPLTRTKLFIIELGAESLDNQIISKAEVIDLCHKVGFRVENVHWLTVSPYPLFTLLASNRVKMTPSRPSTHTIPNNSGASVLSNVNLLNTLQVNGNLGILGTVKKIVPIHLSRDGKIPPSIPLFSEASTREIFNIIWDNAIIKAYLDIDNYLSEYKKMVGRYKEQMRCLFQQQQKLPKLSKNPSSFFSRTSMSNSHLRNSMGRDSYNSAATGHNGSIGPFDGRDEGSFNINNYATSTNLNNFNSNNFNPNNGTNNFNTNNGTNNFNKNELNNDTNNYNSQSNLLILPTIPNNLSAASSISNDNSTGVPSIPNNNSDSTIPNIPNTSLSMRPSQSSHTHHKPDYHHISDHIYHQLSQNGSIESNSNHYNISQLYNRSNNNTNNTQNPSPRTNPSLNPHLLSCLEHDLSYYQTRLLSKHIPTSLVPFHWPYRSLSYFPLLAPQSSTNQSPIVQNDRKGGGNDLVGQIPVKLLRSSHLDIEMYKYPWPSNDPLTRSIKLVLHCFVAQREYYKQKYYCVDGAEGNNVNFGMISNNYNNDIDKNITKNITKDIKFSGDRDARDNTGLLELFFTPYQSINAPPLSNNPSNRTNIEDVYSNRGAGDDIIPLRYSSNTHYSNTQYSNTHYSNTQHSNTQHSNNQYPNNQYPDTQYPNRDNNNNNNTRHAAIMPDLLHAPNLFNSNTQDDILLPLPKSNTQHSCLVSSSNHQSSQFPQFSHQQTSQSQLYQGKVNQKAQIDDMYTRNADHTQEYQAKELNVIAPTPTSLIKDTSLKPTFQNSCNRVPYNEAFNSQQSIKEQPILSSQTNQALVSQQDFKNKLTSQQAQQPQPRPASSLVPSTIAHPSILQTPSLAPRYSSNTNNKDNYQQPRHLNSHDNYHQPHSFNNDSIENDKDYHQPRYPHNGYDNNSNYYQPRYPHKSNEVHPSQPYQTINTNTTNNTLNQRDIQQQCNLGAGVNQGAHLCCQMDDVATYPPFAPFLPNTSSDPEYHQDDIYIPPQLEHLMPLGTNNRSRRFGAIGLQNDLDGIDNGIGYGGRDFHPLSFLEDQSPNTFNSIQDSLSEGAYNLNGCSNRNIVKRPVFIDCESYQDDDIDTRISTNFLTNIISTDNILTPRTNGPNSSGQHCPSSPLSSSLNFTATTSHQYQHQIEKFPSNFNFNAFLKIATEPLICNPHGDLYIPHLPSAVSNPLTITPPMTPSNLSENSNTSKKSSLFRTKSSASNHNDNIYSTPSLSNHSNGNWNSILSPQASSALSSPKNAKNGKNGALDEDISPILPHLRVSISPFEHYSNVHADNMGNVELSDDIHHCLGEYIAGLGADVMKYHFGDAIAEDPRNTRSLPKQPPLRFQGLKKALGLVPNINGDELSPPSSPLTAYHLQWERWYDGLDQTQFDCGVGYGEEVIGKREGDEGNVWRGVEDQTQKGNQYKENDPYDDTNKHPKKVLIEKYIDHIRNKTNHYPFTSGYLHPQPWGTELKSVLNIYPKVHVASFVYHYRYFSPQNANSQNNIQYRHNNFQSHTNNHDLNYNMSHRNSFNQNIDNFFSGNRNNDDNLHPTTNNPNNSYIHNQQVTVSYSTFSSPQSHPVLDLFPPHRDDFPDDLASTQNEENNDNIDAKSHFLPLQFLFGVQIHPFCFLDRSRSPVMREEFMGEWEAPLRAYIDGDGDDDPAHSLTLEGDNATSLSSFKQPEQKSSPPTVSKQKTTQPTVFPHKKPMPRIFSQLSPDLTEEITRLRLHKPGTNVPYPSIYDENGQFNVDYEREVELYHQFQTPQIPSFIHRSSQYNQMDSQHRPSSKSSTLSTKSLNNNPRNDGKGHKQPKSTSYKPNTMDMFLKEFAPNRLNAINNSFFLCPMHIIILCLNPLPLDHCFKDVEGVEMRQKLMQTKGCDGKKNHSQNLPHNNNENNQKSNPSFFENDPNSYSQPRNNCNGYSSNGFYNNNDDIDYFDQPHQLRITPFSSHQGSHSTPRYNSSNATDNGYSYINNSLNNGNNYVNNTNTNNNDHSHIKNSNTKSNTSNNKQKVSAHAFPTPSKPCTPIPSLTMKPLPIPQSQSIPALLVPLTTSEQQSTNCEVITIDTVISTREYLSQSHPLTHDDDSFNRFTGGNNDDLTRNVNQNTINNQNHRVNNPNNGLNNLNNCLLEQNNLPHTPMTLSTPDKLHSLHDQFNKNESHYDLDHIDYNPIRRPSTGCAELYERKYPNENVDFFEKRFKNGDLFEKGFESDLFEPRQEFDRYQSRLNRQEINNTAIDNIGMNNSLDLDVNDIKKCKSSALFPKFEDPSLDPLTNNQYNYFCEHIPRVYHEQLFHTVFPFTSPLEIDQLRSLVQVHFITPTALPELLQKIQKDAIEYRFALYRKMMGE